MQDICPFPCRVAELFSASLSYSALIFIAYDGSCFLWGQEVRIDFINSFGAEVFAFVLIAVVNISTTTAIVIFISFITIVSAISIFILIYELIPIQCRDMSTHDEDYYTYS